MNIIIRSAFYGSVPGIVHPFENKGKDTKFKLILYLDKNFNYLNVIIIYAKLSNLIQVKELWFFVDVQLPTYESGWIILS
jgi:hypothetical protein